MGITWNQEAIERIVAALLAAHPGLQPNYKAMAIYFGQGATYDSMQGRFRGYRKVADTMREEHPNVDTTMTPRRSTSTTTGTSMGTGTRTPSSSRVRNGRVTKPSTTKAANSARKTGADTPSKTGRGGRGNSVLDSIMVDDEKVSFFANSTTNTRLSFTTDPALGVSGAGNLKTENHRDYHHQNQNVADMFGVKGERVRGNVENVHAVGYQSAWGEEGGESIGNGHGHAVYGDLYDAEYDDDVA
ncbi:hypothetical protein AJ80_04711 [Polytolypa hystricis UAMH7299]|uniref:Uncharacterized protein n=1 Tax=Polytolypa hystricis (strain UAMH7299) TaxID=1447883 RepID=A0A2B7Y9I9_POLH7|nr:hypothetical protein AJ80_04711 [Polytolypa hystricis UAMH7299]